MQRLSCFPRSIFFLNIHNMRNEYLYPFVCSIFNVSKKLPFLLKRNIVPNIYHKPKSLKKRGFAFFTLNYYIRIYIMCQVVKFLATPLARTCKYIRTLRYIYESLHWNYYEYFHPKLTNNQHPCWYSMETQTSLIYNVFVLFQFRRIKLLF